MTTYADIRVKIEEARKELLDLTLRNPLLNYRYLRARGVEMVGESAAQVFDTLVVKGRTMSFLSDQADDEDVAQMSFIAGSQPRHRLQPGRIEPTEANASPRYSIVDAAGYRLLDDDGADFGQPEFEGALSFEANQTDRRLQTAESSPNLQKRLLNTYRIANTSIEETGVNTLFLALGMLRWYEADQSLEERRAPLILVPVRLERSGVRERFRVVYTDEDIGANLSLIEKVRSDFRLSLPGQDDVDQVADGAIDVGDYFDMVSEKMRQFSLDRWRVDPDSVVLGFFAYNKILMYRDLDDGAWPDGAGIEENEIIRALFGDGFSESASTIPSNALIDDHLSHQNTYHVLDADSSQALAIHDANGGRNLVIQGPPGTGKSQTITNIIAEAVGRGKRVLFVSEKMAALEVVKRRLDNIGLGDACLELHSHKTNKRETLDNLGRILKLENTTGNGGGTVLEDLARTRSQLNDYATTVNTPVGQSGVTPHEAFGELLALTGDGTATPISWTMLTDIGDWSSDDFRRKREVVEDLRLRLRRTRVPSQHLFYGSRLRRLLPVAQAALGRKLDDAESILERLSDTSGALADALGLDRPKKAVDADHLLSAASHSINAPDTGGLDLSSPQWVSHKGQIREMMALGLQWRRMCQGSIEAAEHSLQTLSHASGVLAEVLGLDHPVDVTSVDDLLSAAVHSLEAPDTGSLNLAAPEWESHPTQIQEMLAQGLRWQRMHSGYEALLLPQAWETDFNQVRQVLDTDGRKFLGRIFSSSYKQAKRQLATVLRAELPKGIDRQIALIDDIGAGQQLRAEINGHYTDAALALGRHWEGYNTDWDAIAPAVRWWLDVLTAASEGRARPGAVRLLQKLKVWPNTKTPRTGLQTADLLTSIDGLKSALDAYRASVKELQSVLDADNRVRFDAPLNWAALPFSEQRRMIIDWIERPSRETQDNERFNNKRANADRNPKESPGPDEVVAGINSHGFDTALALGSRWQGHNTDWDAIAPAAGWWLDVLTGVAAGNVPPVVADLLREIQERMGAIRWQTVDPQSAIDNLGLALGTHQTCVTELQSELNMDNQLRFSDATGLRSLSFAEQRGVLGDWAAHLPEIQDIIGFNNGADAALEEGLHSVAAVAEQHPDAAALLTIWFERAWYESIVETAYAERPALRDFDGQVHEGRIERFQTLDRQSLEHNRARVGIAHRDAASQPNRLPKQLVRSRAEDDTDSNRPLVRRRQEQLRVLRREIEKRSRHKPIRQLLEQAGNVIQDLKPVFMMSPLSIATYLAPGSAKFDLAVFDEASQVRPVDALGALLRTKKAVVVGDSKQLPPTSFFDRVAQSDDSDSDEEESATSGIESILALFSSSSAPERQLRWHYRSRHESLIALSNREFYDNNLIVFPSPDTGRETAGLRFHHLPDTVYDRSRSRTNRQEAEAVAQAVMKHATRSPELSLGVAAFSVSQSQAIQDRLEMLRRQDVSQEDFFGAHPKEPFFVKNLENVQGDERDVIFISVGYGRDDTGQVAMNFGPINNEGGERRLNVLITRAKQQCHVFTNLRADDINLDRTRSSGVRALKEFLAYAETGVMPRDIPYESDCVADSPFQLAVAKRLEERGYLIHQEVGSGGKFIDIGVVDQEQPGRYIIGVECDGASYHSSRSARDRDRLREEVLRSLGWELHRIWGPDWFSNPERELDRVVDAIERAKSFQNRGCH